MMRLIGGIPFTLGATARLFFGPFPRRTFITSIMITAAPGMGGANYFSLAFFSVLPADTSAAFATGEQLCLPYNITLGSPAVPLPSTIGVPPIPIGVRIDVFRYLGVQITANGASSYLCCVDCDVGQFARALSSVGRTQRRLKFPKESLQSRQILHIPREVKRRRVSADALDLPR